MLSGAACRVLCLLLFFWTLLEPGDESEAADGAGVDLPVSASSAGTLYSGLHKQVEPSQSQQAFATDGVRNYQPLGMRTIKAYNFWQLHEPFG